MSEQNLKPPVCFFDTDDDLDVLYSSLEKEAQLADAALRLPKGYLSASQVLTYHACPKSYEYRYVHELYSPPSIELLEGGAVHRGLEAGLREKLETGKTCPKSTMLDAYREHWKKIEVEVEDWGDEGKEKACAAAERRDMFFLQEYKESHMDQAVPVGVEQRFYTTIGQERVPVLGFIDLVEDTHREETAPDGSKTKQPVRQVVDHKVVSRSKSDSEVDNDMQLTLYAMATNIPYVKFNSFVKTKDPKIQTRCSARTTRDYAWVCALFIATAQGIDAGYFPPTLPTNWKCGPKYCGYYNRCRGL